MMVLYVAVVMVLYVARGRGDGSRLTRLVND